MTSTLRGTYTTYSWQDVSMVIPSLDEMEIDAPDLTKELLLSPLDIHPYPQC